MASRESPEESAEANTDKPRALAIAPGLVVSYLSVPENLRGLVVTLFHFAGDRPELADMFPAMTGFVSIRLKGESWIAAETGVRQPVPPATLLAPTNRATSIGADGPFHAIGAVLSPRGWATFSGLHAGENAGRIFPLDGAWGELAAQMQRDYAAGTPITELAVQLTDLIALQLSPIEPRHDALIRECGKWLAGSLDPSLEDFYARCAYSERQAQRLIERYYGCTPKLLVRKFRALRVFAMLIQPGVSDDQAAAVIDLYYDQSHLIREFKRFIGRTPRQLAAARLPVLATMLQQRNFRPIWPETGVQGDG